MNPPENQCEVGKFRKKQVEVEAVQWTGENIEEIHAFMSPRQPAYMAGFSNADDLLGLPGGVANKGDWVIKDDEFEGYFAPCPPDVFEETYEPA